MGAMRIISTKSTPFDSRVQSGRLLAAELQNFKDKSPIVLGIPRGGVIVAGEIASALDGDLDVMLTRKLGSPGNPELAIGAVAENGAAVVDETLVAYTSASQAYIDAEIKNQTLEIARRSGIFRMIQPKLPLGGRVVIITDDGVATGSTMLASLMAAHREKPAQLICALPVGPQDTIEKLAEFVDLLLCLRMPPQFAAVGQFYLEFEQTSDEEVVEVLKQNRARHASRKSA